MPYKLCLFGIGDMNFAKFFFMWLALPIFVIEFLVFKINLSQHTVFSEFRENIVLYQIHVNMKQLRSN